ncbi:MAG TPA: GNAT family N-acetyltransferase [Steroidobacteraceae bacterium]
MIGPSAWERFVEDSPEAWLFHTALWQAVGAGPGKDRSFGLVNERGALRAVIALHLERIPEFPHLPVRRIYNYRAGLARANGIAESERAELDAAAVHAIRQVGRRSGAAQVSLELASMAPGPNSPDNSVLARSGFEIRSMPAKVIDLTQTEAALWKEFRKGCKSAVKKAQRERVDVCCARGVADVEIFSALHAQTMRATDSRPRPTGYFSHLWNTLSPIGRCQVLLARLPSGDPIAGIMTMQWKGASYYYAAATAQKYRDAGGNTLCVHEAILKSRARGDQTFHLGPTPHRGQVNEKIYFVGRFKNQFGGFEVPWRTASLFLWPGLAKVRAIARSVRTALKGATPDTED